VCTLEAVPASGATVVTQWTRLAFDPDTLLVDTADFAFATSKGSVNHPNDTPGGLVVTRVPYGVARDCAAPSSTLGTANIDLTGLPFEVDLAATKWGCDPSGQPPPKLAVAERPVSEPPRTRGVATEERQSPPPSPAPPLSKAPGKLQPYE